MPSGRLNEALASRQNYASAEIRWRLDTSGRSVNGCWPQRILASPARAHEGGAGEAADVHRDRSEAQTMSDRISNRVPIREWPEAKRSLPMELLACDPAVYTMGACRIIVSNDPGE